MTHDPEHDRRSKTRREGDRWSLWDKRVRDAIIFMVGIAGVVNEVFLTMEPRPAILLFLGSLIGVPFVLSADEVRRKKDRDDG